MADVRTVLIGMAPLFADLMKLCLKEQTAWRIVGELPSDYDEDHLRSLAPEVTVVALRQDDGEMALFRLSRLLPGLKTLAISPDCRRATAYVDGARNGTVFDFSLLQLIALASGCH